MSLNQVATKREEFVESARAWLEDKVPARWRENRGALDEEESDAIRHEWDRELFRGGFAGISLPKEFGGQGLSVVEEVLFSDLAARAKAPDGLGRIGRILAAPTLVHHGTEDQLARFLPPTLRGDMIWCQGFSEPSAGSDLAGVSTRAVKVDGGYLVSGRKTWTSFARHADRSLILVKSDPEAPRHRNLTMLLLDMRQSGVTISPVKQASGASHFAEVTFDEVFVEERDRVAGEGDGWKVAMTVLQNERGGVEAASRYVEIHADIDLLADQVAGNPEYREAIEDLTVRLELVRWQVLKTIDYPADSTEFFRSASILKLLWSELWQDVTSLGLRTMTPRTEAHWRFQYLETRAATIYSGSSEIQRNIISERVLGLPR